MPHRFVAAVLALGLFSLGSAAAVAAAPAPNSADWVQVDNDVWTLFIQESQTHLLRAQEDLSQKDVKTAAAEIRMAAASLKIQEKRLAASAEQLNELAKGVESNEFNSPKEVKDAFGKAASILDHRQTFLPFIEGADVTYMNEANYHLAQAKALLKKQDDKGAAGAIVQAAVYLKLKAVHADERTKRELVSSDAELAELARALKAGGAAETKDMDVIFERARQAVRRAL